MTTALNYNQLRQLQAELAGYKEVGLKGLLSTPISLKTKFHLTKLFNLITQEADTIGKIYLEYMKTHGEPSEDGQLKIPETIVSPEDSSLRIANPRLLEHSQEIGELLFGTHDIEHAEFTLADFDKVETDEVYPVFYLLLKEAKESEQLDA